MDKPPPLPAKSTHRTAAMKSAPHPEHSTERELLQHQQFLALNKLSAGVAHEFNNLVAGILGSAELIALDLPEDHPSRETLKQIFEASHRARDFIHKLRELAQRPAPVLQPLRLGPIIEESCAILQTIIPPKVELLAHIDADCPAVLADPAQMQQTIIELCVQSWHGLPERRGAIEISLKKYHQEKAEGLRPRGNYALIGVSDNGHGLDKSSKEKIFEPFHTRRSNGKKIGLELFLVRETVHAHQGEIVVESEPGHGLAFHVYLPAAKEK